MTALFRPIRIISIHAPRVGSDQAATALSTLQGISIHAPRVGSDSHRASVLFGWTVFQSTLPVWGATVAARGPRRA